MGAAYPGPSSIAYCTVKSEEVHVGEVAIREEHQLQDLFGDVGPLVEVGLNTSPGSMGRGGFGPSDGEE